MDWLDLLSVQGTRISLITPKLLWTHYCKFYRFLSYSRVSYPWFILGWRKSNCSFALLSCAVWYWNTFLNKCATYYVIYHFNMHFSLCFFANDLLLAVYFIFILDYKNDVRQKTNLKDFFNLLFLLNDNCFTEFCCFLSDLKMNQP